MSRQQICATSYRIYKINIFHLGAALAGHITTFRNDAVGMINARTSEVNNLVESTTYRLAAYNQVVDSYEVEDFQKMTVQKNLISERITTTYTTIIKSKSSQMTASG